MYYKHIEKPDLAMAVIEQLQAMILDKTLAHGDKLPPERVLSENFNVGRSTIREAMKALEIAGIIERRQGDGNYITNNVHESIIKQVQIAFSLSNGTKQDIYDIRSLLEVYACHKAALVANKKSTEKLFSALEKLSKATTEESLIKYDMQFHYEIARIAQNKLLLTLWDSINYLFFNILERSDAFVEEHEAIAKAIAENNPKEAVEHMKLHLEYYNGLI